MIENVKTKAVGARLAIKKLKRYGVSVDSMLADVGLSASLINKEDGWIPYESFALLIRNCAERVNDPYFGLHLGEENDILDYGAIAYIGIASETLEDAMLNLQRYLFTVTQAWKLDIQYDEDVVHVIFTPSHPEFVQYRHAVEAAGGSLMIAYQRFVDLPLQPREFHFIHNFDGDPKEHERVLACPVKFSQNRNQVVLDRSALALPIATADDRLLRILTKNVKDVQDAQAQRSSRLVARIEEACMQMIPAGNITAKRIAAEIGTSERSMQRRLAEQNKTFSGIVDELKRQLALKYMRQPDLGLMQIAFLLGYADQSSFTTAFRKWTGMTPKQARLTQL